MFRFWCEWMLAVHRAVWFPFNWATGLERPGVAPPVEFAPALMTAPSTTGRTIEGRSRLARKKPRSSN